ncbi:signal recognition particle-docking protein FtsY [Thermodesulfobium sp. 4217-1]|uniref:signal recognition particle-docking protein FtsY n=1 Tax=Thermodesulfobium sp. 4217-1 TaxID=3120013 RepID=UPI0032214A75
MFLFDKVKEALTRTRRVFSSVVGMENIDWDEILEKFLLVDVGSDVATEIVKDAKKRWLNAAPIEIALKDAIEDFLPEGKPQLFFTEERPCVWLLIGVNGSGKTTTCAKLAKYSIEEFNASPILVAADTFRAAAIDQLKIWGERLNLDVISQKENSDPAAVVFDGLKASKGRKKSPIIIDTAGRLHTKDNLMEELKKIERVIGKEIEGEPSEVLLVLDASTGYNAVKQAEVFGQSLKVTGIILTKLDSSAKGGYVLNISKKFNIPVKFIGVGEGIEDLVPFDKTQYAEGLIP